MSDQKCATTLHFSLNNQNNSSSVRCIESVGASVWKQLFNVVGVDTFPTLILYVLAANENSQTQAQGRRCSRPPALIRLDGENYLCSSCVPADNRKLKGWGPFILHSSCPLSSLLIGSGWCQMGLMPVVKYPSSWRDGDDKNNHIFTKSNPSAFLDMRLEMT